MRRISAPAARSLLWVAAVILLSAFQAAVSAGATALPVQATPSLWVVERDGNKLYLFGSMHLLPAETQWRRAEIDRAMAASQVFAFEAPLDDGAAMRRFVETDGRLKERRKLKDLLPAALHGDLETAAWRVHYPPQMLESFRPWLAGVYLELYAYIAVGFSTYYGVDRVIEREAEARGATLAFLETVDEQLSYFSRLGSKVEVAYLRGVVRGILNDPDMPTALLSAWASGRNDELANLIDKGFRDVPGLRADLLVARNRKWLPRIKEMLASGKTHFVTIGAGHLVGKDSVVALLRAAGYRVTGP